MLQKQQRSSLQMWPEDRRIQPCCESLVRVFKLFYYLLIYLASRAKEGALSATSLCPKWLQHPGLGHAEPGVRNSTGVSHVNGKGPSTGPSPVAFLDTLTGSWITSGAASTADTGCWCCRQWLKLMYHNTDPVLYFWELIFPKLFQSSISKSINPKVRHAGLL